jgi:hypothetical protein
MFHFNDRVDERFFPVPSVLNDARTSAKTISDTFAN